MDINKIQNLKNQAISGILQAKNAAELENLRIAYLGRNGKITDLTKQLKNIPTENRKEAGQVLNDAKKATEEAIANQQRLIGNRPAKKEWFDVTLPGTKPPLGHQHPITQAIEEISRIFEDVGYQRIRYPEITTDWYCFEGVNVPPDHPSRDDQETFFLENGLVLSTHTTSGLLREAERLKKPPIRMLNIAKCYRRQVDVSHTPMFHQFEGWLIDKGVNIGHLRWTLDYFAKQYFGPERKTRIRPHHFQYTEPSFEVDVTCGACKGKGCRFCKDGWTELGGSGMAHPKVLSNAGIDPKIYSGFGFGWGVERVFSMKTGVNDGRLYYQNELPFLEQF